MLTIITVSHSINFYKIEIFLGVYYHYYNFSVENFRQTDVKWQAPNHISSKL